MWIPTTSGGIGLWMLSRRLPPWHFWHLYRFVSLQSSIWRFLSQAAPCGRISASPSGFLLVTMNLLHAESLTILSIKCLGAWSMQMESVWIMQFRIYTCWTDAFVLVSHKGFRVYQTLALIVSTRCEVAWSKSALTFRPSLMAAIQQKVPWDAWKRWS